MRAKTFVTRGLWSLLYQRIVARAAMLLFATMGAFSNQAAHAQGSCPNPPFTPPPALYTIIGAGGGMCGDVQTGSIAAFRASGEAYYRTNLQSSFGTLTFDYLNYSQTPSAIWVDIRWTSQRNGDYQCTVWRSKTTNTCLPAGRNLGAKQCPALGGTVISNPVNASTGNKYQKEPDYQLPGAFPLDFQRYYNSGGYGSASIGTRWTHTFERNVSQQDPATTIMTRDDGEIIYLSHCATGWCGGLDLKGTLTQSTNTNGSTTGWAFVDENDVRELYDGSGRLLSETAPNGRQHTLSYDTTGRLSTVTDSFGHQLSLQYDSSNRVNQLTLPDGGLVAYAYDSAGNLSSVTYPDTTTRTYLYDEPTLVTTGTAVNSLTGIVDEAATRFATFQYNDQSQAILSEHAGGADATHFTYNSDGSTTVLDAAGATRSYSFQTVENVNHTAAISGPSCAGCALSANYTYDSNGNFATKTDFNGNQTTYQYDTTRNLETSRTEAAGTPRARTITTAWHPAFRRPTSVTEPNRTTGYTYDVDGNTLTKTITDTSITPNVARTWTYTYDIYGRVLTADGPRTDVPDVTTYTYYSCSTGYQCGQVQTMTNAAGQTTTYNTYNAHAQPLTITDANGVVTTLTYDARQRLTSRQTANETTAFDYWPTGSLKKVTLPDGSYIAYTYDGAHRLTQIKDALNNKTVYTLDAMGNRTAESSYDPANALHRTHSRVFNTLNQLSKDVNAAGTVAVTTTFGYDPQGNQTSISAPLARNTANAYDELNRLKQMTDPANGLTQFGYDANDNLTSLTDPRSLVTTYAYNGFGDLNSQTSPDSGTTANTYDPAGNLATATDARGAVSTFTYDALNRVTSVVYSQGGVTDQAITIAYDAGTNGKGHVTSASDANHSLSWTYDSLGRVTSKSQTVVSVTKSVGYAYTSGNLTSLTTPSGQTVAYGYNGNHQVTSIAVNGTTILNSVTYEPLGSVSGWTWGNGTTTTRTYDTDGTIQQIVSAGTKTYTYDDAMRITNVTDTSPDAANWTYGYDNLNRLTSGTSPTVTRGWTYDANGNRLTETGTSPSAYTISPTSNRIASITGALARTYAYDAAGNTTGYSTITASYNNIGRLETLTNGTSTETSVYNALGQRIWISGGVNGTVLYAYDEAGHPLGEYDGTGTLTEETVWLGDIPVATLRPNGVTVSIYYVHTDPLNTPRQVTRPSDNMAMWSWNSDPFGTDATNPNPAGAGAFVYNLRFPGQLFDGQAGLHYNYLRDYDPAKGAYITGDPIGLAGGSATYAYVAENPINFEDPNGELPLPLITALIGAGAGAVGNLIDQLSDQCHPFSATSLLVATGGGFAAGLILPWVPGGLAGAAAWGGISNFGQYWVGSELQGQTITPQGSAFAVVSGIFGGVVGGPAGRASRWGYGGTAASRAEVDASNAQANWRANLNRRSLVSNFWGGVVGNAPEGGGPGACPCGQQ